MKLSSPKACFCFPLTDPLGSLEYFVIESSLSLFFFSFSLCLDEVITSHGAIEADKENVRQEPYSLPQGFMWDTLDLGNAEVVSKTLDLSPHCRRGLLLRRSLASQGERMFGLIAPGAVHLAE